MLQDIECAVTQCRERWFVLSWFYQIAEANLCIIEIGDCCAQFPSQGGDNTLRTEKVIGINNQIFTAVRISTNCCGEEAKPPSELRIDSASSVVVCNCATLVSSPAHPGRDKVTELSSVRRCSNVCRVSAMGRSTDKSGADVSEYCRITSPMTFLRALVAKNQNFCQRLQVRF